jgi:hypothetical protein
VTHPNDQNRVLKAHKFPGLGDLMTGLEEQIELDTPVDGPASILLLKDMNVDSRTARLYAAELLEQSFERPANQQPDYGLLTDNVAVQMANRLNPTCRKCGWFSILRKRDYRVDEFQITLKCNDHTRCGQAPKVAPIKGPTRVNVARSGVEFGAW